MRIQYWILPESLTCGQYIDISRGHVIWDDTEGWVCHFEGGIAFKLKTSIRINYVKYYATLPKSIVYHQWCRAAAVAAEAAQ